MSDTDTKDWIRNASDELAVKNGCRFDVGAGKFTVQWIEKYCILYEGDCAGQPIKLHDWALDVVMRLFGWKTFDADRKRWVRRFKECCVYVPKKNGKTPTLASIGLYLLAGDGEKGQKVFSCAKDGKQAMLAQTHAIQMVQRSPELSEECKINKSTGRIVHEPTQSFFSVISGDNIKGQEGLNGSLLVDETHVVDEELMRVLRYMGISRSEPLHIEVSTAGNNPDGYGFKRWQEGRDIESGKTIEQSRMFAAWAAPQDISDKDLDENILAIGKAANPAWGRLIKESEFIKSYNTAKRSISDLLDFKMYRLNVWQRASNPWLKAGDWQKCLREFTEDDLVSRKCWAGLDLSRTRDMSALVLVFQGSEPDSCFIWPFFFLPKKRAYDVADKVPSMLQWVADGHLILTDGDVIDYNVIKEKFVELHNRFQIQELVYDEKYANEITQDLSERTGVIRIVFKQDDISYAAPTADFERLVIGGRMHHNGHPVLTWQAGHVGCARNTKGDKRPAKPDGKKDSVRTIDGIAAGIMALARANLDISTYDGNIMIIGGEQ